MIDLVGSSQFAVGSQLFSPFHYIAISLFDIYPYLCYSSLVNEIKMEKSKSLTYKILLHKEPEGEYTVTVPALPGCITYGENIDHAIEMAKEAIELYISELKEKGIEIPDDSTTIEYSINLIDA
jgi:predicted RNase H-like HicB family nuclease